MRRLATNCILPCLTSTTTRSPRCTSSCRIFTASGSGVYGVLEIEPKFVVKQIEACVSDIGCDAVKTGMLSSDAIIDAVASTILAYKLKPLVVDR
jgi:hydroxymethylpyrimidine/phosphomethylpyrimidine kinase